MEFLLQDNGLNEPLPIPADGETSQVQDFYAGRTILITGGTGFLGKLLLEKLLRSCPNLQKVYLVTRLKNHLNMQQRLDDLFNLAVFDKLKEQQPNVTDKVEMIRGDCCLPELGLGPNLRQILCDEVEIIFNCAATTMFDVSLKSASDVNVRSLRDLIVLAKKMKKLKAFVHLSTVYVNCSRKVIDETFATSFISSKALIEFVASMDKNISCSKPINFGKHPNNFTFTKSIAEDVIRKDGAHLPIAIIRPAGAISTWKDPIPGWTDNVNGPSGLVLSIYLGLAKSILANKKNTAHLMPADQVINAIITAAWDIAKTRTLNDNAEVLNGNEEVPIYNLAGFEAISWGTFFDSSTSICKKVPTKFMLWRPWNIVHTNLFLHSVVVTFCHYIPAGILDFFTYHFYAKTKYLAYYSKIDTLTRTLAFFTLNNWEIKNGNTVRLRSKLSSVDRGQFDFAVDGINWEIYFYYYILGIRLHVLKDGLQSLPEAIGIYQQLILYSFIFFALFLFGIYFMIKIVF